jgi:glycosyltransferase involved in cell wall biosynthesis
VAPEISVVVESYNHAEGSALERFALSLEAATERVARHRDGEVLVADSSGDADLLELLERRFPDVRRIDTRGLGYDRAKMRTATEARGRFLVFLDGDCVPDPDWLERHVSALRDGAHASSGLTLYDGGFLAALEGVMDFGFLLPEVPRALPCYASNNTAFRREVLLETPAPDGPMRCNCYAHAQLLVERGTPVHMTPGARVTHERQAFFAERFRRGFDLVAACWANPGLPETRLLRLGVVATPFFYLREVANDLNRLRTGRRELGIRIWQLPFAAALLPVMRLADVPGIVRALAPGGRKSGIGLQPSSERLARS